jgi:vacuolar-type H+-ATPase subunit D/Vma8
MKFDLRQFDICKPPLDFYDNYDSFEDAWNACPRGDWMLWIAHKLKVDHRILTLAKSRCARTVIHLMKDKRSINAVEISELYGLGKATEEELHKAYQAASSASSSATAAYDSAFYASYAASATAYSSSASYAAIATVAYATATATATAAIAAIAKLNNQQQTADICREILTESVFKHINETL